jgi:predicted GIY-YIG superfamily endonuclease
MLRVECPEPVEGLPAWAPGLKMYFVYILQCCDGSYYVGFTNDVPARVAIHSSGNGPKYTARRLPVHLVYQESITTLEGAVQRERQLKGWSRAKKAALISHDFKRLAELAGRRQTRESQKSGTKLSPDE